MRVRLPIAPKPARGQRRKVALDPLVTPLCLIGTEAGRTVEACARRAFEQDDGSVPRHTRTNDWGFPRWRAYGAERDAATVQLCDVPGCGRKGDCPAPKGPNTRERWHFCQDHAAAYNASYDYFAGLNAEEAAARAEQERQSAGGFRASAHWAWAGGASDGLTPGERDAYRVLGVETGADAATVKAAYRKLAKAYHPDTNTTPGATERFHAVQAAYELLRKRETA